jgi:hypothetical protein
MRFLQAPGGRATALLTLAAVCGLLALAGRTAQAQAPTTIGPTATPAPEASPAPTVTTNSGGATVTFAAGWNLVALPPDTDLTNIPSPLYTWAPTDTDYETIDPSSGTSFGYGYWAYFTSSTQITLGSGQNNFFAVIAPAATYFMVGDPSGTESAIVTGADVVYTYDPVAGQYGTSDIILPGQGAWVYSTNGGPITVTPMPNVVEPPQTSSQPPAGRFYGSVTVSGAPASGGTTVTATSSSGATCGSSTVGAAPASGSNYSLDLTGSDPSCTTPGSTLTFTVGGSTATVSGQATVPDVPGAVQANLSVP